MRWLAVLTFLVVSTLLFAQNGAQAVAAKALQQHPLPCDTDASISKGCHANYPAGCGLPYDKSGGFLPPDLSYKPRYDAYLAYFKNQIATVLPTSQGLLTRADFVNKYVSAAAVTPQITAYNHSAVSAQMLALGEGQYFSVIGYLYYTKINDQGEASNCDITNDEPSSDYHIGIGFDPKLAKTAPGAGTKTAPLEKASIVVEMTPHYRAKYHKGTWTNAILQTILGRQVRVVGQLLLDNDHMTGNAVCSAPGASTNCWRLSPWEFHPVTEFYVCKSDSCVENSPDWIPLDTGKF